MDSYTHSARKVVGFFNKISSEKPDSSRKHQKIPSYRVYSIHASIVICGTLSRSHVCELKYIIYNIYFKFCYITCKYVCVCVNDANDKKTLQQQSSHNQLKSKTTTISSWPALLIKMNSSVIAQDLAHPQMTWSYPIWMHSVSDSLTLSFAQIFDHISQDLRVNLLLLI